VIAELVLWVGDVGVVSIPEIAAKFGLTLNRARLLAKDAGLIGRGDDVRMLASASVSTQLDRIGVRGVTVAVPRVIVAPLDVRTAPWLPVWAARNWPIDDSSRVIRLKPPPAGTTAEQLRERYGFLRPADGDTPSVRQYLTQTEGRMLACIRDLYSSSPAHTATRFDYNRLYTSTHRQVGVLRTRAQGGG